jgi:hypothetical protein
LGDDVVLRELDCPSKSKEPDLERGRVLEPSPLLFLVRGDNVSFFLDFFEPLPSFIPASSGPATVFDLGLLSPTLLFDLLGKKSSIPRFPFESLPWAPLAPGSAVSIDMVLLELS